jgi:hypothetical protein
MMEERTESKKENKKLKSCLIYEKYVDEKKNI